MTEFISAKEPITDIAPILAKKGIRISLEAEELLKKFADEIVLEKLIALNKPFLSKEDIEPFIISNEMKTQIERANDFIPSAKEYEPKIVINHTRDVTGKSRTKGETENFINYFRNRYERLSRFLRKSTSVPTSDLSEVKKHIGEKVRIIVLISDKKETKKGNLLFEVEDMTGTFKVVISSSRDNDKLIKKSKGVLMDDVVAITGKILEPYMIAEDIEWPDMPIVREKKQIDADLAVAYISDIHFGSRYFLEKQLDAFTNWLHCRGESKDLAGKVKYLVIAGDSVDGIGVYPNQEKELVVKDIYKQYELLDDFIQEIPDYIEVIVIPGNHDAVRRGEPQPALGKDLLKSDVLSLGNPTSVSIEGLKHLIYHGTSLDSMIANIPEASYMHPEKVMVEYLKRRHLSPIYGGNPIIPENIDYMVIDDAPDVFHCGHIHRNGYTQYRGTLVINSGTFQDRTDYQIKQGHVPTPGQVPVYEMKYNRLRTLDFSQ
ncbi:DNA-directed DNA polymerase II small subunit [Candidatus Micrarchaeota archaeon]|nr:DNA-directed DNA polymerase II small subunit [Candidatus Micrarchaeota archaeon]